MSIQILVLMIAGGLLIGVGSLWFLSVAFRYGVLWGLLCIFLSPIAPLIFLITHWNDAKKPFLLSLLGSLLFGASMGIAAYEESKSSAARTAQTSPTVSPTIRPTPSILAVTPSPAPEASLPPMTPEGTIPAGAEPQATPAGQPAAAPPNATPAPTLPEGLSGIVRPPRPPEPPSHTTIRLEDLSKHTGEILRFRLKNGRSFEGRIREIGPESIKLERNTIAGKMTFDINLADIEEVLKRL
jgi:hypothetical protein